ncbi:MAG: serine hydrolase [Planctomycetota bacterium]
MHLPTILTRSLVALAATILLTATRVAAQFAYHDQTLAYHQQQIAALKPAGWRMISLSIYGTVNSPLYAAVWVQRPGPDFQTFQGLTGGQYQVWSNASWQLGYRPKLLTAMGDGADPRFAGVYELAADPAGWTLHGLTPAQLDDERKLAQDAGLDVTTIDIYGTATDPRYIVGFGPVSAGQHEVKSPDQATFLEHAAALVQGHARPALIATNGAGNYLSLWQSNTLLGWFAATELTSGQYQNLTNAYAAIGKYPISVQASGAGSARRFAAIWAPSDLPASPTFTKTGVAVGPLTPFDNWVQNWMTTTETRAAALAVVKDARLVFARGYTNDVPAYPITQPTSLFEIASNSKPITAIAMAQHFHRPQSGMSPSDTMLSHLPFAQPLDPRVAQIRLDTLLTHQGGWDRDVQDVGFDPMFYDRTIATALGISLPISKVDIYTYMLGQQLLDVAPDSEYHYSNFGYSILGRVLEANNPGLSYGQIIDRDIFQPLGLTRPRLARSLFAGLWPGEVTYHPWVPGIARTVVDGSGDIVPRQYGVANKETMDSHGGWVMAAPDYAKILAAFDLGASNPLMGVPAVTEMWTLAPGFASLTQGWRMRSVADGTGGQVRMHYHGGLLAGAASFIAKREDGLSFVFFTNGDKQSLHGDVHGNELSLLANQITAWPSHDLFYSTGIPPFVHVSGALAPYGQSCPGTLGHPHFALTFVPDVGDVAEFAITNAPANRVALVLIGLQQSNIPLASIGAPGCTLLTPPIVILGGVTDNGGSARIDWQTPPSAAAIGLTVHSQAAIADQPANPFGAITTRAVSITMGGWQ